MSSKGKRLTYLIVSLGVLVLVAAAVALKPAILEQWYLWKLDSEDDEDQKRAADKLSELGTLRTITALIEKLPDDFRSSQSHFTVKALASIGEPAAPLLLQRLKNDIHEGNKGSTAYRVLEEMGSPAVSVLISAISFQPGERRSHGCHLFFKLTADR